MLLSPVCVFVVMICLCAYLLPCVCYFSVLRAVVAGTIQNKQTQKQTHIASITRVPLLFDVLCCLIFVCCVVAVCVFVVCVCVCDCAVAVVVVDAVVDVVVGANKILNTKQTISIENKVAMSVAAA